MKKVITILAVLTLIVGSVFAAAGDPVKQEVKVELKVNPTVPTYRLYASLANTTSSADATAATDVSAWSTATAKLTPADDSIIGADVKAYCVIKQLNESKYTGSVDLTVSATALSATVDNTEYKTADPTISDLAAQNNLAKAASTDAKEVRTTTPGTDKFTVVYSGKKAAAADIASFTVTWPQTDLPPATYSAYIRMEYTAL